jgi:tripartite-type tricarboxylate transporter receptor subunit TctC
MNKLLAIFGFLFAVNSYSAEIIKIYSPYSPAHSGTPALFKIVDSANSAQNIYKFVVEFKPGGNQIIAVKSIDPENSLAIIAPAFVDNIATGKLNANDYVPVYALGDACWVAITNAPLKGRKELVVGGVGFGNAAHLTSLALGEKYGFNVRYIVFKSNNDALVNMAGNNGIEFVIDKYEAYEALKAKNPKLQLVAASCPTRIPQQPKLKTFKELGFDTPYVFNTIVAHKDMGQARRKAISSILKDATDRVGEKTIFELSAMKPPQFYGMEADHFHEKSVTLIQQLQIKFKDKIEQSK